jgi:hypothetical protein
MEDAMRRESAFTANSGLCEMQAGKMLTRNSCIASWAPIGGTSAQRADCEFNRPSNLEQRKRAALQSTRPRGRLAEQSANAPVRDDGRLAERAQLCAARDRAGCLLACTERARVREAETAAVMEESQQPGCVRGNVADGAAKSSRVCCERAALRRGATPPRARALPCSTRSAASTEFPGREQVKCPGVVAAVFLQLKVASRLHWALTTRAAVALKSRRSAARLRVSSKTKAAMPTAAAARGRCVRPAFRQSQSPRGTTLVSSAQAELQLRSQSTHRSVRAFLCGDLTRGSAAIARMIPRRVLNTSSRNRGTAGRVP